MNDSNAIIIQFQIVLEVTLLEHFKCIALIKILL